MIFDSLIRDRATGNQNAAYKWKVSGTINTEMTDAHPVKRLALLDRVKMEVCGLGWSRPDKTFIIKSRYQPDESLVLIGFDEGENYNADIYDRISLCSEVMALPSGSTWRKLIPQGKKIWTSANFATGTMTNTAINGTSTGLTTSGANTGNWVSPAIPMTKYDVGGMYNSRLQSARLGWCYPVESQSVDYSDVYRGFVAIGGGAWVEVTEGGGEVPGLDEETDLNGMNLHVKMELDSLSGSITPRLIGVCIEIY